MLLIFNILVFAAVVLVVILGHTIFVGRKQGVSERLAEIQKIKSEEEEIDQEDALTRPFYDRVIQPFFQKIGEIFGNLTPGEMRTNIEKKITYAGNPKNLNFNRFVSIQVILVVVLFAFSMLGFSLLPGVPGGRAFGLSLLMGLLGIIIPVVILNSQAAKRQLEIQRALPDTLDMLLVSVEAGLGFDMAMKRVAAQSEGALIREISRALEEIRMGKSREESLRGIVFRTGVPDLSSFISAIIQAEQLGTNIANTLRVQANTMRQKRRQRAEQAAMKAPIKMLFPIVLFIFPSLFVVILGPAVIQIVQTFLGMF